MPWQRVKLVLMDEATRIGNCCLPYPRHKKGCPNFGKKPSCPPKCKKIDKICQEPFYAIYNIFDFESHIKKMRDKFPNWSDAQVRCVLYWQPTARKQLKQEIESFRVEYPKSRILPCPEGAGVDIDATMKNLGIVLEWPPEKVAYQIVIAGQKKQR